MKRWLFLIYGASCHLLFFVTYAYLAGFVGNFLVSESIDSIARESVAVAVMIDLLLLGLFAVQHTR